MAIENVNLLDLYGRDLEISGTHKDNHLEIAGKRVGHVGTALLDDKIDIAEALSLAYLQGQFDSAMTMAEKELMDKRDEGNDDIIFKA